MYTSNGIPSHNDCILYEVTVDVINLSPEIPVGPVQPVGPVCPVVPVGPSIPSKLIL
jgi:hypothetical protein